MKDLWYNAKPLLIIALATITLIVLLLLGLTTMGKQIYGRVAGDMLYVAPGIVRVVDDEAGVVCWHDTWNGGGLFCMPVAETRLGE